MYDLRTYGLTGVRDTYVLKKDSDKKMNDPKWTLRPLHVSCRPTPNCIKDSAAVCDATKKMREWDKDKDKDSAAVCDAKKDERMSEETTKKLLLHEISDL